MLRSFDRWLFEEYRTDLETLAIFRVLFSGCLLFAVLPGGLWVPDLPGAAYNPPVSLAALFTHYPPAWVLVLLNAITLLCVCMLFIGYRTVAASFGVAAGLLSLSTFAFADGKIDHSILLVLTPFVLARSGWGAAWSVDAARSPAREAETPNRSWLLSVVALLVGLAVLSAGLAKIRGGWLSPGACATRWHLLANYYVIGLKNPLAFWAMNHLPSFGWKLMDYSTVAWEVGLVCAVPSKRLFLAACAIGTLFHFGVWWLFGILFPANVLVYAAFVEWSSLAPSKTARVRRWLREPPRFALRALVAAPFLVAIASMTLTKTDPSTALSLHLSEGILTIGLVGGVIALGTSLRRAVRSLTVFRLPQRPPTA